MGIRDRMDIQDAGFLAGGLVFGIVFGIVTTLFFLGQNSDTSSAIERARLTGEQPSDTPSAQQQDAPDQVRRCVDAATAMKLPVRRAAASLDQWEIHVGAMNKLVTGVITVKQATTFWNRTRLGARHRVAEFERGWSQLQRRGVDCPPADRLPIRASRELRSCAREVTTDMHVLDAARTAIHTWGEHVRAMDRLRMGRMSSSTATRMWLAMWQRGQQEIDVYRVAARQADNVSGCPSAAPLS